MKKKGIKIFVIISLLFCLVSCGISTNEPNTEIKQETVVNNITEIVKIKESELSYVPSTVEEAVEAVYDSVVVINASSINSSSSGSGVMIGESNEYTYIITCHHVIENESSFQVILNDGTSYSAILIGGDKESDIAIIAIEKVGLQLATFISDSHNVGLASTVIAIGNPLGTLGGSVTVGVVSSTNRLIEMSDGTKKDLIQTDAAINSGNSGGGLFNTKGELIGIVNAKYSATGVEGLGFAIPANTAKSIAIGLIEKGYVEGRYNLGVTFSDGYYRTNGYFGKTYKVVYVSNIDSNGSCSGLLQYEDILVGVEIIYKDSSKESVSLTDFSEAQEVTNFFNSIELSIGDKIIYQIKRGTIDSATLEVQVEVLQYVYKY